MENRKTTSEFGRRLHSLSYTLAEGDAAILRHKSGDKHWGEENLTYLALNANV